MKELWKYRDLIFLFVKRDFVARYKQTILGPFWFILNPLLSTFIYTIIFNKIAKIPTDGADPVLFYLSGLVAWNYFSACLNGTSYTFLGNAGIFGKVYFPRLVSPISNLISNLIQFGIQFGLLVIVMAVYFFQGKPLNLSWAALLIPVWLIMLALLGFGFGIIISSLTVKYRDLTNLMGFGVQLWMYATPIIYPINVVPFNYQKFILLNPVAPLTEAIKFGLIGAGSINANWILYSLVFTMILLVIGIGLFNQVEKNFMDTI